ncbi:MAG: tetratricopeptide repeat protein, partial [Muribaculaceae bacterium]|nr:tetratricopeptide repeat protein [Muribaculaceae bacterium]
MNKHISLLAILSAVMISLMTGCGGEKLATANEQMDRGEYFDAANTYRKVYNKLTKQQDRPLRGEVAYKMGLCYNQLNMSARATAALQNAIRYNYPDSTALLLLAVNQQADGKYADAIKSYEQFLTKAPGNKTALNGIAGCRLALDAKGNPTRYVVKQNKVFNSRRSDFSPMYIDSSLDQLYFTTTNEKVTGDHRSEITGMKKGDIWFSRKNERGEWMKPEPVEGELNTEMDEGIISFSPDGSTMYLTKARRSPSSATGVEIHTSQRSDAKWSAPVKLEITADTLSSYGHPAVSPDGRWLCFTSDMPGGQGGRDLWRINLKERAGSLENMGEFINTVGDEMFPYWRTDSILYFASDGHPGFGGLDLFKATLTPSGGWRVENMGQPVNSAADDFG